jgi:hypothetical protein
MGFIEFRGFIRFISARVHGVQNRATAMNLVNPEPP